MNTNITDARLRLLDAALQLFTEKGYASASVSEIVAAAGVTKPMLYYYFKNKEGLYLELMNYAFCEFNGVIEKHKSVTGNSGDRIISLFVDIMNLHVGKKEYAKLIYAMLYGPPQGAPFVDFEQYHLAMAFLVSDIFVEGIRNNELAETDVEKISTILLSVLFFCMDTHIVECAPEVGVDYMRELVTEIINKYRI